MKIMVRPLLIILILANFIHQSEPICLAVPDLPDDIKKEIKELSSPYPAFRYNAALRLKERGEEAVSAIPYLIATLDDNAVIFFQPLTQSTPGEAASEALARIGQPAVGPLLAVLTNDNYIVRARAVFALGEIKDDRAVFPIIDLLEDSSSQVRLNAVKALKNFPGKRVVGPLIQVLKDDEPLVRLEADKALVEVSKILVDITLKDFGMNSKKWQQWWDSNKQIIKER